MNEGGIGRHRSKLRHGGIRGGVPLSELANDLLKKEIAILEAAK
jgi:hypothetical protein